ncbi:MAG: hypothetical protein KAG94_03755 [Clostridiales bacterium]|nr:hypothetical protein [Clostridiales bacterium]
MKKTKNNYPINNYLNNHALNKAISFHMPGHTNGRGFLSSHKKQLGKYDITEIIGADNYHEATGIIKESLTKIAKKTRCDQSLYLLNGTSSGILALMKYVSVKKGKILIPRDAHQSIINGSILFDTEIVFAYNEIHKQYLISNPISLIQIKQSLLKYPDISHVLITSPTYYGFVSDIRKISEYLHEKGIALFVDQAHGSHFIHNKHFPISAIRQGADVVVESLHKTQNCLTQSAIIHGNKKLIDLTLLMSIVKFLTTTSPSYLLMANMEKALLSDHNKAYNRLFSTINFFIKNCPYPVLKTNDISRVVIDIREAKLTGNEITKLLHKERIDIEMATLTYLVLITTPNNRKKDFLSLLKQLNHLEKGEKKENINYLINEPVQVINIRKARNMPTRSIQLNKAIGKICGTIIVPYPPGIPLLYYGEEISQSHIDYITLIRRSGQAVMGLENDYIKIIEV